MTKRKENYIVLIPKNESAKEKIGYHGERWILKNTIDKLKFTREEGPFLLLMSRDGTKYIHVKQSNDSLFNIRNLG